MMVVVVVMSLVSHGAVGLGSAQTLYHDGIRVFNQPLGEPLILLHECVHQNLEGSGMLYDFLTGIPIQGYQKVIHDLSTLQASYDAAEMDSIVMMLVPVNLERDPTTLVLYLRHCELGETKS